MKPPANAATSMTTADLARIYNIPAGTIRRWASEGRLCRLGTVGRARYRVSEVDQLARLLRRVA